MADDKEEVAGTPIPVPSKESVRLTKFLRDNKLSEDDLKNLEMDIEAAKDYFTDDKVYQIKSDAEKKAKRWKKIGIPMAIGGTLGGTALTIASGIVANRPHHFGEHSSFVDSSDYIVPALASVGLLGDVLALKGVYHEGVASNPEKKAGKPLLKAYKERLDKVTETKRKLKKAYYKGIDAGGDIKVAPRKVLRSKKDVDDYVDSLSYSELLSLSRTLNGEPM